MYLLFYFNLDDNYDQESHVLRSFVGKRGWMVICGDEVREFVLLVKRFQIYSDPFTTYNNNKQQHYEWRWNEEILYSYISNDAVAVYWSWKNWYDSVISRQVLYVESNNKM